MTTSEALTKLCSSLTLSDDSKDVFVDPDSLISFYRPTNNMEYLASKGRLTEENYRETLIPYYVPGIVLTFFTLCGILWSLFLILRKKNLICTKYWKSLDSHSFSDQTKRRYYIIGAVITLVGFSAAIAGIVFSTKSLTKADQAYCQYYEIIQRISQDGDDKNWMGLDSITSALSVVESALPTMKTNLDSNSPSLVSSYTDLETKRDDLLNELDTIYSTYGSQTVTMPALKTAESPYNPPLLKGLGPTSTSTTTLGIFRQEVLKTSSTVEAANDEVLTSTNTLTSSYSTYLNNIYTWATGMGTVITWWDSFTKDNMGALEVSDTWSDYKGISKASLGFFIVTGILNVGFLALKGMLCKEKIVKENRVFSLLVFLGLILTISYAVLLIYIFPTMIKTVEVCHLVSVSISNENAFKTTFKYYTGQTTESVDFLNTCLHKSGELYKKYVTEDLFDNYETYLINSGKVIEEDSEPSTTATDLITIVNQYLYFRVLLDKSDNTRSVSLTEKLAQLNKLTDFLHSESLQGTSAKCRVTADVWKFTEDQCTGDEVIPVTGYEATTNFGKPTCLNFVDISTQSVSDRYINYRFFGCDTMSLKEFPYNSLSANIIAYVNSFGLHVDSVQTVLGNLVTDLTNLNTNQVNDFFTEIDNIATPVTDLVTSTQDMTDIMFPSKGYPLKGRLNCAAIKDSALQLQYKVCDKLTESTKGMAILMIITYVIFLLQSYVYFRLLLAGL